MGTNLRDRQADRLVAPEVVAEFLGRPVATLRNWRYRGQGPRWVKVEGRAMYRWSDVERYVEQNATGPGPVA